MENNRLEHPSFIYRGGDMLSRPPFQQKNSQMYGFFVKGQLDKLQACIDRDLNTVAGGQLNFKPLSEYIMLTFTDIGRSYSDNPQDFQKGWGQETDVCFWVPVGNIVIKNGQEVLDSIHWYTPYIWVNSPIAMVAGRDIYGYPKTIGRFELPEKDHPDHFSVTVNSFKDQGPDTEAEWNSLLTLNNLRPGDSPIDKWENFIDALKGIHEVADGIQLFRPDMNADEELIKLFLQPQIPQLFLKQFPANNGEKAAYQALVSAPAKVEKFHQGGTLPGDYQLTLEDIASIPIAEDLGLSNGPQDAVCGFWLNFDFVVPAPETLVNNTVIPAKKKIAILGGGVSSCAAAYGLTSQPGWQDKYDITLYQLGWRIGGKGASGRNSQMGERIEEHGLHIWLGFYENAFEMIQKVYSELDRPEGAPLRTWQDAFKPQDFIVHMENIKDEWLPWYLNFPPNDKIPGQGDEELGINDLIETLYAYLKQWLGDMSTEMTKMDKPMAAPSSHTGNFLERLKSRLEEVADRIEDEIEDGIDDLVKLANGLLAFVKNLPKNIEEHSEHDHNWLDGILEDLKEWLEEVASDYLDDNAEIRHLYIGVDLAITILKGMHKDDIYKQGFDVINGLDLRQWLRNNGANEEFTVQSAPIRALYDLVFAYEDGDITTPNLEAGTGLRGMLLLGMGYSGSIMWKMQAGMGDTIFTPFYQVLKKRGVKFKYFHQVDELLLDPNNADSVQQIKMTRQVDLINGADHYDPLVYVKGLGCWPSEPLYNQLVPEQAALLQDNKVDLENFWNNWAEVYQEHYGKPLPEVTLERGKDFDEIIFGISIASIPHLCPQLLAQSPALKTTVEKVKTVVTQAYQLWTTCDLQQLGWTHFPPSGQQPVLTAFTEPVDTWCPMNQLLCREDWTQLGVDPKNVAYFCGVQDVTAIPPQTDHDFPIESKAKVKAQCLDQLNHDIYWLWPEAATDKAFRWSLLVDPDEQQGEARFDAQYWRSNVSPTERYVQSVVNSTKHRIATDGAGFDNVYFTGDWIKNGLNAGCVEGATMSGLQTSRAICGWPKFIKGEKG